MRPSLLTCHHGLHVLHAGKTSCGGHRGLKEAALSRGPPSDRPCCKLLFVSLSCRIAAGGIHRVACDEQGRLPCSCCRAFGRVCE